MKILLSFFVLFFSSSVVAEWIEVTRTENTVYYVDLDKILKKHKKNIKFDIRFHLNPNSKVMKTLDNKSILIELENEAWKFSCDNFDINIDNGIYFVNKNSYIENQNIFISGVSNKSEESIKWEISKLQ